MNGFTEGQKIRAQFPLRPDLHVDLIRGGDGGWRRLDRPGPNRPYQDAEIERVSWLPLDDLGIPTPAQVRELGRSDE